jgi:tetratricopeptide (TPR) repeat protein
VSFGLVASVFGYAAATYKVEAFKEPQYTGVVAAGPEVLLLADKKNADYCFEQCLKLCRVDDWQTPFINGLIHEERRLWAKAIQYYAKVAEHDERNAALWYHVGLCRAEMGQRPHAEKAFERAAQFCPPGDSFIIKIEHAKPGTVWKRVKNIFRKK